MNLGSKNMSPHDKQQLQPCNLKGVKPIIITKLTIVMKEFLGLKIRDAYKNGKCIFDRD